VHDVESTVYLLSYRYRCQNPQCRRTLTTLDIAWLAGLPPHIADQVPVVSAAKTAYTKSLCNLVATSLTTGTSVGDLHDTLSRLRTHRYARMAYLYHNHCQFYVDNIASSPVSQFFCSSATSSVNASSPQTGHGTPFERFGDFFDHCSYNESFVSADALTDIFHSAVETCAELCKSFMGALEGTTLAADHSHFVASRTKVRDNAVGGSVSQFAHGLLGFTNELSQVISYSWTRSTSGQEVLQLAQEIAQRHRDMGKRQPRVIYTDKCCDNVRAIFIGSNSSCSFVFCRLSMARCFPLAGLCLGAQRLRRGDSFEM
jgi:hypothetical protein